MWAASYTVGPQLYQVTCYLKKNVPLNKFIKYTFIVLLFKYTYFVHIDDIKNSFPKSFPLPLLSNIDYTYNLQCNLISLMNCLSEYSE